ncbi:metallophosphoesterase [Gulosibacter hominis]|uniref:metallophosphoesterase n=1 Tax=Gulosibacter hominis TaxID=2770504 RepID=UPI001919D62A|nr:metallophosphoesterase [Gulosibacter hominis]
MPRFPQVTQRTTTLIAATCMAFGVTVATPAFAADERSSFDSPALASVNELPNVVDKKTVPVDPRPGFRVLPYLQKPAADQMTINWFSEQGNDATLIVTGPGLPEGGKSFTVSGKHNPVTQYQDYELNQGDYTHKGGDGSIVRSASKGSWIRANGSFKYSQTITELQPNANYSYSVILDGYRHDATFSTAPVTGSELDERFYVVAMSDSETEPRGRVRYREWEQTRELGAESEARPGQGSAYDTRFGGGERNGQYAVNYMLTEDDGQYYNNQIIAERQPDLLLMPGDLVEQGSSQTHWDDYFRNFAGDRGHLLDSIPVFTSLGNHEVYGYGKPEDRSSIVRSRMYYNHYFDTFGSDNPSAMDAYHRIDQGKVTFISLDVTNGQPDSTKDQAQEDPQQRSARTDENLTPEQYGTDTQGVFTLEEYQRDFHVAQDNDWIDEPVENQQPDQPSFMPGSEQYKWFEAQLQDAREKGQIIVVQWHHVAYSNGVHGTPMGNEFPDDQPGVPTRHLQPLIERYGVAAVISGHDEMFQASYVDENNDGIGVYHWDVGVASDGLRADKKIQLEDGSYEPQNFNTHEVWSAQRDEPEVWQTNENGVQHLVSGGKHYGHLDMVFDKYTGSCTDIESQLTMTPVASFPILDDDYNVVRTERRELTGGVQHVYFNAAGQPVSENDCDTTAPEPTDEPTDEPTAEPTADPTAEPTADPTAEPTNEPTTKPTASEAPTQDADSLATTGSEGALGLLTLAAATLAGGLLLRGRRRRAE